MTLSTTQYLINSNTMSKCNTTAMFEMIQWTSRVLNDYHFISKSNQISICISLDITQTSIFSSNSLTSRYNSSEFHSSWNFKYTLFTCSILLNWNIDIHSFNVLNDISTVIDWSFYKYHLQINVFHFFIVFI